jgi:hypothetical protein
VTGPSVLVLGRPGRPHADAIAAECRRRGTDTAVVCLEMLPKAGTVTARVGVPAWSGRVALPNGESNLHEVRAAWYEPPGPWQTADSLPFEDTAYARSETDDTFVGLWHLMGEAPGCSWVNHPYHVRDGSRRAVNVRRAAQAGFAVPRTVLTNDVIAAARQLRAEGVAEMVYRPLRKGDAADQAAAAAFTAAVGEAVTEQQLALLPVMCGVLQERVAARRLVRAIVVGGAVLTAATVAVEPGQGPDAGSRWQPWALPDAVARLARQLVWGYGLRYAVVSLAVTDADEYVFLDHDPTGDFFGVHTDEPELGVVPAIADELLRRAGKPAPV